MAILSKNNHKNRRQNIYSIPFQPGNGLMLCMIYLSVVTYDQQKFALDWLKAFSSTNHKKLLQQCNLLSTGMRVDFIYFYSYIDKSIDQVPQLDYTKMWYMTPASLSQSQLVSFYRTERKDFQQDQWFSGVHSNQGNNDAT